MKAKGPRTSEAICLQRSGGSAEREAIPPGDTLLRCTGVAPEGIVLRGGNGRHVVADLVAAHLQIADHVLAGDGIHGRDILALVAGGAVGTREVDGVERHRAASTPELDAALATHATDVAGRGDGCRVVDGTGRVDDGEGHGGSREVEGASVAALPKSLLYFRIKTNKVNIYERAQAVFVMDREGITSRSRGSVGSFFSA